ncbi:MAG: PAS domain S-box protein [Methanoregula sp.]|nr:PAS domain S-box protein [Methanoregula sp.]
MTATIRILYVDDEPSLLDIGKLFLEKGGVLTVDTLTSAIEALEQLKTKRYDAILSDYQMPEMDGITFLKQLKALGDKTPFIIFTGRGREEVVIEALNSGADFYIQKGGDPKSQFAELSHKIKTAVSRQKTEKLAKDTDRRLNDIINFLPDATFAIDTKGTVIAWNKAIEEMTGVPAREMLGKGNYEYAIPFYGERRPILINLVSIPDEELTQGKYAVIKKEGDILIAETELPRPLGRYSVLLGKASILYNDEGQVIGAIESIRDITDMKMAEKALAESRRRLEAMATNIFGVVYRFCANPDGTYGFDYIGERSRQILGLENDPVSFFQRVYEGIVPEERQRFIRSVQHAISTKTLWEFSSWYVKPSGKKIWISAVSSPAIENERLVFDGVIFDNTECKKAEEFMQMSELKYRLLIESSSDAIFCVDENGAYQFTNLIFASTFAKTPEFFIGKTFWDIYPKEHADLRQLANLKVFETGEVQTLEVEVPLPHTTLYFLAKANPIKDETGKVILNLTHATDITDRKRVEQAIRQANQKLLLLLSITRHDINNQLTVLLGYQELVAIKQVDHHLIDYCQKVITAAQRIYAMIQFTKEYESLGISAPAWYDTSTLIQTAAKQASLGKVMVKNDIPSGYEMFADPLIIKVCYNLMENAVQYGKKITTIRFSVLERNDEHLIICEDDGVGVLAEEKEKIFERGFGKNTGLGLALSREILSITGITIKETGEPGIGARFELTVPNGMWRIGGKKEK